MNKKTKFFIGTSGWIYKSWDDRFYPIKLKENKLKFYSKEFNSVELNFSFYKLPSEKMFEQWFNLTPKNFKFSIKLNRYITHTKKLKTDKNGKKAIKEFLNNAEVLKNKLSVILIQLPTNFKINLERLKLFINFFSTELLNKNLKTKMAFEFRNDTWFSNDLYEILKKYNATIVISDSLYFPFFNQILTNFIYIRFHGPNLLYASKYSEDKLQKWAKKIKNLPRNITEVYSYFNNDFLAFAIHDAKYLKSLLNQ